MGDLDEQKKQVLPYLQRAEEIQSVEPKIAYYCRVAAVEQGLKLPNRAREISQLLSSVINKLEKDKQSLDLDPANDKYYCEQFALTIFKRADKVDRAGRADVNTSKAFYAAAIFLEICNQFGEQDADLYERQRYALWRAAEIRKALREGRQPLPPSAPETSGATSLDSAASMGSSVASGPVDAGAALFGSLPESRAQPPAASPSSNGSGMPTSASSPAATALAQPYQGPPPGAWQGAGAASAPPPPGASTGPAPPGALTGPPPRFRPGSKVLFCPQPGVAPPEHGTVAKVIASSSGPTLYMVALRDRFTELPEPLLAEDFAEGGRVLLHHSPSAPPEAGTVVACNTGTWPPTYSLKLDNGYMADAQAQQLSAMQEGGAAGMMGRDPAAQQAAATAAGLQPASSIDADLASSRAPMHPSDGYASIWNGAPPASSAAPAHDQPHYPAPSAPQHDHQPTFPPPPAPRPAPVAQVHQAPAAAAPPAPSIPAPVPGYQPPLAVITEATKFTKYAASSLAFEDVTSAVKYLTDALKLLTQPGAVLGQGRH